MYQLIPIDEEVLKLKRAGRDTRNQPKRKKEYLFPHWVKYVAWFLCISIIITSSTILILYGMEFGLIKSYLWLTTVLSSFFISVLVTQPIRIFALTIIKGYILKKQPQLLWKKITKEALNNRYNEAKLQKVLDYRKKYSEAYEPTPAYKLKDRFEDIKYTIELRTLTIEVLLYVLFMIALYYVVLINKSPMAYYSSEVINNMVVKGSYINGISLLDVKAYDELLYYLNYTLLPTLLVNSTEWHHKGIHDVKNFGVYRKGPLSKRIRRTSNENLSNTTLKEYETAVRKDKDDKKAQTRVYDRGWTLEKSIKLIGKIRMRQIRVRNDSCDFVKEVPTRENECPAELNIWNEERRRFSINWNLNDSYKYSEKISQPWIYQSGWESGTVIIHAKFKSYPGGGYIAEFAKSLNDSRIILKFLDELQWIDFKTRAVFIEFTTYSVDTNLFNVVDLILERSAVGYFIPSYHIHTTKFMFMENEVEIITTFMLGLFTIFLFIYLVRESIRIQKTSLRIYVFRGWSILDFAIISIGFLSIVFTILRSYYVSYLFRTLEKSANNKFVSFSYAAAWDTFTTYINAILICLSTVKLFRILTFRVVFHQMETTIRLAKNHILTLSLQMFVLIIGFSVFFHLTLIFYDYGFSSYSLSLSTMINRAISMDDTFDFSIFTNTSWYLGPLFLALFIISISVVLFNLFISIIVYSLGQVKRLKFTNKYNIFKYIKYRLSTNHKGDVLRLRGGGDEVLRLKGGGGAFSKCRRQRKEKEPKKETTAELVEEEVSEKEIISTRKYDSFVHYGQPDVIRFEGMKHTTKALLSDNKNLRRAEKEKAMMAIVLKESYQPSYRQYEEKFYFGSVGERKTLVSSFTLSEMKDFAEEFLQEKKEQGKLPKKSLNTSQTTRKNEDKYLQVLDRKLGHLIKLSKSREN